MEITLQVHSCDVGKTSQDADTGMLRTKVNSQCSILVLNYEYVNTCGLGTCSQVVKIFYVTLTWVYAQGSALLCSKVPWIGSHSCLCGMRQEGSRKTVESWLLFGVTGLLRNGSKKEKLKVSGLLDRTVDSISQVTPGQSSEDGWPQRHLVGAHSSHDPCLWREGLCSCFSFLLCY